MLLHTEKGSVMVEFAFVSTVLIVLLAGIIQFGLIFNTQLGLENAAREGARFASLPANANNDSTTISFIQTVIPELSITAASIEINPAIRSIGEPVTVNVNYTYQIPVTLGVFPNNINLRASATMMQN